MIEKVTTLKECISPAVQTLGFELWGCELQSKILRIYIDSTKGITVEDCSRVSRQVSALLNVIDPIDGPYSLEVSSPGINRPLFERAHYEKQIGQRIKIKTVVLKDAKRKLIGTLLRIEGDNVHLLVDGVEVVLPFKEIEKANVIADVHTR